VWKTHEFGKPEMMLSHSFSSCELAGRIVAGVDLEIMLLSRTFQLPGSRSRTSRWPSPRFGRVRLARESITGRSEQGGSGLDFPTAPRQHGWPPHLSHPAYDLDIAGLADSISHKNFPLRHWAVLIQHARQTPLDEGGLVPNGHDA
jgi:hypothetical protein